MIPFLAALLALLVSASLSRLILDLAPRLGWLDHPGARKLQSRAIPLLGGVALYGGFLAGALLLLWGLDLGGDPLAGNLDSVRGLVLRCLAAGLWLVGVGLVDDRRDLPATLRFLAQLLALVWIGPELWNWLQPNWLGLAIGAFWVLGLVNSLNFLDNMDAAAGSTGLWTALALALPFLWSGNVFLAGICGVLAASLLGFLLWNRPPARLYMGDAGSTWLGFTLATLSLTAVARSGLSPWLAPLLLAVPIYDTCTVFWIRWREGRRLWIGDRRHVTHRMLARGAGVKRVLLVLNAWTIALASVALLWQRWGRGGAFALGAVCALGLGIFAWEWRRERRRG